MLVSRGATVDLYLAPPISNTSYASMSKFGKETNIPLKGLARNDSYMSVDEPYRGPLTR